MFRKITSKPLIVRKVYGIGWTLNPAHPLTWVVLAAILATSLYFAFSG